MSLAMQGIDMERAGIDMTAMREKLRDSAGDEVRGQLLLEALADQQKLEVAEAEVAARIAELAAARDKTAQKLRAEMDRDGSLESLKWRMRQEKALDLVVARATISEEDKQND
jgi:trigger factor